MSIQAYWPISPYLVLSTGTSIGYEYYLEGDANANGRNGLIIDGINENAASRFDVDFSLSNNAIITLSNSFSANIGEVSTQTGNEQRQNQPLRIFQSVSSLRYAQRLNPNTTLSSAYTFSNTFTKDVATPTSTNPFIRLTGIIDPNANELTVISENGEIERNIEKQDVQNHMVSGYIGKQLNDYLTLTLQGSISNAIRVTEFTDKYTDIRRATRIIDLETNTIESEQVETLDDVTAAGELERSEDQYQLGPRISYRSKSGLSTSAYLAVKHLSNDNGDGSGTQDDELTALVFESSVSFAIGSYSTNTFNFSHSQEPSGATITNVGAIGEIAPVNFQEENRFAYELNYLLNDHLTIDLAYELSQIKESGGGNQFSRETASIRIPFQLNARTTVSTNYAYSKVFGSDFDEFNYDRHSFEITFRLNF